MYSLNYFCEETRINTSDTRNIKFLQKYLKYKNECSMPEATRGEIVQIASGCAHGSNPV